MAKVQLDLNKAVLPVEAILGNLTILGVDKKPKYVDGEIIENQYVGVSFKLASDLQGREVPFDFNFYKFESETLAMPKETMDELLATADTVKFMSPVEVIGFTMKQATETKVQNRRNDAGKWAENKVNVQMFDVVATSIKPKKVVAASPVGNATLTRSSDNQNK